MQDKFSPLVGTSGLVSERTILFEETLSDAPVSPEDSDGYRVELRLLPYGYQASIVYQYEDYRVEYDRGSCNFKQLPHPAHPVALREEYVRNYLAPKLHKTSPHYVVYALVETAVDKVVYPLVADSFFRLR